MRARRSWFGNRFWEKTSYHRLQKLLYSKRLCIRAKHIVVHRTRQHYLFGPKNNFHTVQYSFQCYCTNCLTSPISRFYPRLVIQNGVRFVAKRGGTLGNTLSPTALQSHAPYTCLQHKGCYSCGISRCGTCKYVMQSSTFLSKNTVETFNIKSFINCSTTLIIYMITCVECAVQYVGCTTRKFWMRVSEHLNVVNKLTAINHIASGTSKHFIYVHKKNLSSFLVQGIERVNRPKRGDDLSHAICMREAYWILKLWTRHPSGLSLRTDLLFLY